MVPDIPDFCRELVAAPAKSRNKGSQELYVSRFLALLTDLLRLWILDR